MYVPVYDQRSGGCNIDSVAVTEFLLDLSCACPELKLHYICKVITVPINQLIWGRHVMVGLDLTPTGGAACH